MFVKLAWIEDVKHDESGAHNFISKRLAKFQNYPTQMSVYFD